MTNHSVILKDSAVAEIAGLTEMEELKEVAFHLAHNVKLGCEWRNGPFWAIYP
jgi:hypothetical protein